TWRTAHYGDAWRLFSGSVAGTVRKEEATLTLGARAGSRFDSVIPRTGRAAVRVLMDRLGHPLTAVAAVTFAARGMQTNGGRRLIRSAGHYFLRPARHGWAIYAFDVTRSDQPILPAGGSPTLSPTAGASP